MFLQGEVQCASVSNVLATNNSYCNIMVSIVMGSNSLATSALTHWPPERETLNRFYSVKSNQIKFVYFCLLQFNARRF